MVKDTTGAVLIDCNNLLQEISHYRVYGDRSLLADSLFGGTLLHSDHITEMFPVVDNDNTIHFLFPEGWNARKCFNSFEKFVGEWFFGFDEERSGAFTKMLSHQMNVESSGIIGQEYVQIHVNSNGERQYQPVLPTGEKLVRRFGRKRWATENIGKPVLCRSNAYASIIVVNAIQKIVRKEMRQRRKEFSPLA